MSPEGPVAYTDSTTGDDPLAPFSAPGDALDLGRRRSAASKQPTEAGESRPTPAAITPPSPRSTIRILPTAVAARIAAGETIERPASVVKELVENAIDAGATAIRIDVRDGGLGLIRVSDDGHGMRAADVWLACQRHATSKLPTGELDRVQTLGFRGEALPAIAAVAELAIVTAPDDRGIGWKLILCDGQIIADEPAPRPRGTMVAVRHLFQHIPARLATVSRPQAEIGQIGQTVRHLAIAAPSIRFTLMIDDRAALHTTGSGDLATTLIEVYGDGLAGSLLTLGPVTMGAARCHGVIASPDITHAGRGQINLIINGRWVQPRGLLSALERAYRPLLPRGRHPLLALVIETAPDRVDVNIHPAKLDVRLRDERAIAAAIGDLMRDALGRQPLSLRLAPLTGVGALAHDAALAEEEVGYDEEGPIITPGLPPLMLVGQLHGRLLLLEGEAGLFLVDQHRAHERVLYERLTRTHHGSAQSGPESIVLPEPLIVELRPSQIAGVGRRLHELAALGFTWEVFGERTFLLRAAPCLPGVLPDPAHDNLLGLADPAELATTLLTLTDEEPADGEIWRDRLLVQLACRTAVRRGKPLTRPLMRALVHALGQTSAPAVCPHGSPLLMHVGADLLERQFGWR